MGLRHRFSFSLLTANWNGFFLQVAFPFVDVSLHSHIKLWNKQCTCLFQIS